MKSLYYFLFKALLMLPIVGIANGAFMNKFAKVQKITNNVIFILLTIVCSYVLIMFSAYGRYDLELFKIANNIPVIFSTNSINLMFGMVMSISILFLNMIYQNSFDNLQLFDSYKLYNRQASWLYFLYILLAFSNNIIISILIYWLVLICSLFLIGNPDLSDFRKRYNMTFCVSSICNTLLILIAAYCFDFHSNILPISQEAGNFSNILGILVIFILFLLVLPNICYPFYTIFKETFYYEDLLSAFIILFFPFIFLNTFLFIKAIHYVFCNNFNVIKDYLHYVSPFMVLLFLNAGYFAIKFIRNSIKFISLFFVMSFIIFVSQLLLITADADLVGLFSNFLLFILSTLLPVLTYAGILFLLLKNEIDNIAILYKNTKLEINFYFFCLFLPIFVNFLSFFSLNMHNFNILYLVNLFEILMLTAFYVVYVYLSLTQVSGDSVQIPHEQLLTKRIIPFAPQLSLLFIFIVFLLLKGQIVKYVLFYN